MKVAQKHAKNDSKRSATDAQKSSWQNQLEQAGDNRTETVVQRALKDDINNSPRMLAQRQQIVGYLGSGQSQTTFPAQSKQQTDLKSNNTGLPDKLKVGVETLSGLSMDDVRVHYNSDKPSQLQALAYTQGSDIHVAPNQEKHLPHETWHVVQQKQGRVRPTLQVKGGAINDDRSLELEADVMGEKANNTGMKRNNGAAGQHSSSYDEKSSTSNASEIRQRKCNCSEEKGELNSMAVLQRKCWNPVPEGPYSGLPENIAIVDNKDFTDKQADAILAANKIINKGWVKFKDTPIYSSDLSAEALLHSSITRPAEATVDHILPFESGGCNSVKNAQILSSSENSSKGKTWPWGKYKNNNLYVP